MKKLLSLTLALLLCLPALLGLAEAISLPALGAYITPEPGQTLTLFEYDEASAEEEVFYAMLTDEENNRMDLHLIKNPDWAGLNLTEASPSELADIADYVVFGADYLRLGDDGVPLPDVALLTFGDFPFLGISYSDEVADNVGLFTILPEAALFCTFATEDSEPLDADTANELMMALYSLSTTEEGSVPFTETEE